MTRLLSILTILLLTASWARSGEVESVKWWNKDWKYRKIIRVAFPPQGNDLPVNLFKPTKLLGERALTGKAVITIEDGSNKGRQVMVTDAEGRIVPARAYASGWGNKVTVLFKAEPQTADYYLYYGNPKAKRTRMTWNRNTYPIIMVTVPVKGGAAVMKTPAGALKAVLAAKTERGKIGTYSVNNPVNPFGLEAGVNYVTLYSGLMYAPHKGDYQFSLDCGGTAHLLLDNSLVLTSSGVKPARSWKRKAQVRLSEGIHTMTILHGESADAQGIRVGWREPGDRRIDLMTGSAFARSNYAPVELVGFEDRDKEATPFFTVDPADVAFEVPGGRAKVQLKLRNYTRGAGLSFKWQIGTTLSKERSPTVYADAGGTCNITLEVSRGGKALGTYQRSVNLRTIRHVKAEAAVEMIECPNIIYAGEKATITFKIDNLSKVEVPLRYERVTADGKTLASTITLPPRGTELVSIEIPPPPKDADSAQVSFRAQLTGFQISEQTVRVVRPGPHLAGLRPKLGRLVDAEGRRVVVIADLEDANQHRRWAVVKWAAAQLRSRPASVLLFGHPMLNVPENKQAGSYVAAIRGRLALDKRTFNFVQSGASKVLPCVADIPAFAAALKRYTPDLVIISPGNRDVAQGVDRQAFARSLDVMIDIARAQDDPPVVLIVSAAPLLSNIDASRKMASAASIIARRHHIKFVDLHKEITRGDAWKARYQEDSDDSVYSMYPNPDTHRRIADWIMNATK
jgi:GDSL-like lipase/acylhydrolase family protein